MRKLFNDKETPRLSRASWMLRASVLVGQLSFWAPSERTSVWFRFSEGSHALDCLFRFTARITVFGGLGPELDAPIKLKPYQPPFLEL